MSYTITTTTPSSTGGYYPIQIPYVPTPQVVWIPILVNPWLQYPWTPYQNDPCRHCSNNPINGGSGVYHCTLGGRTTVTY